jgi:ATP-dependent Clp protease protease subunit
MAKKFTNICRARKIPVASKELFHMEKIEGENRLEVRNEADETHLYLSGSVGSSWWDEGGITEKEVRDALKTAKKGTKIHAHINSEGGSIQEGLGIYNAFKERSQDITAHVDGYALSIASVFPLAAGKVVSPKSAIWMIHNAWSYAQGNADDMEAQATMLREHDQMLNEIYQEHTGKSESEIKAAMDSETWVRGSEAVAWGLADETDPAEDPKAAFTALPQAWLDRCKNLSPEILNALRPVAAVPASPQNGKADNSAAVAAENTTAAVIPAATPNQTKPMPEPVIPAAAAPTAPDALAEIKALKTQLITNRVTEYVKAQKITKAEIPLFVSAALTNETDTFAILDAKQPANSAPEPVSGSIFEVAAPAKAAGAKARYAALTLPTAKARKAALSKDWDQMIQDALAQDEARNAPLTARGIMPQNSNTYSGTLVTAFLTDGATTTLQNRWAPLRAFSRDFSTDPYKPNAVAEHKYVTAGPTVQTDASNFESGNSTVAPVTITPHQYTSSINVSNSDLNNGLRMENLATIMSAQLANKVIEAATAPITLANFATATASGGGNVITASNFTFTDMSRIWGALQKANQHFAVMDGAYFAKLLLQPTYFQSTAEPGDEASMKAYGWDGIFINSDWTGASNNAAVFCCDPQAIAVLAGLPLTPPQGIPGNTLEQSSFKIPGVEISVANYSWFNLGTRTAWMSLDVIFGASVMDTTAGAIVATA